MSDYYQGDRQYGQLFVRPLPPGPYNVEVEAKGFQRLLQENVHVVAGQTVKLNLKLTIGAAAQSLTVTGQSVAPPPPPPPPPPVAAPVQQPGKPLRVSAGTIAGMAISQPAPVYPDEAKAQHVQGVVVLHARISKEGTVKDLTLVSGPPPLVVSAIDAVRQWKYKPYLLNGEPTEVETTININYTFAESAESQGQAEPPAGISGVVPSPMRVPAGVMERNLISKVVPVYPEIAKAAHVQGVVVLHAVISKTGDVENLSVISGSPMLTASAMDAVKQWKYDPYMLNGQPMDVETTIDVNFTLGTPAPAPTPGPAANSIAPPRDIRIARPPDMELYDRGVNAIADGWYEQGRQVLQSLVDTYPGSPYTPKARQAIAQSLNKQKLSAPKVRSIDFKGLNSVTITQVVERLRSSSADIELETPYDVARVNRAAAVLKQLLAERGHPNAAVTVATQSIPPGAIAIQFNVKEGAKGTASKPNEMPVAVQSAPQQYDGVAVKKIGDGVAAPLLIYKDDPEFTEQARKAKASGTVLVGLVVDKQGLPQNVHILRGFGTGPDGKPDPKLKKTVRAVAGGMNQNAVDAVMHYKFKPATEEGQPVPVALNVEVNFQIF